VQAEYAELKNEIQRISIVTEFNGIGLTRGANTNTGGTAGVTSVDVQVGMYNTTDDRVAVALGDLGMSALNLDKGATSISLGTAASAQSAIGTIDIALNSVNDYRSTYGAVQNRLDSAIRSLDTYSQNLKAAESQIRDADFAHEAAEMSKQQIMQQAGTAILGQANQINQGAVRLIG
jgi:flagellin